MSIKSRDFDRLLSKYRFELRQSDHLRAWLIVDNKVVVRTRRSNVKGDLPAVQLIRQQMHLNADEFRRAVSCTIDLPGYVELLRSKGVL